MAKTIYTKNPVTYIPALAEALKKIPEFEVPEWAHYVKSGTSRQRPPTQEDFWHTRTASILRQLYIKGVVGVGKLRVRYGSRKDRGGKPDKFKLSSGKIIRLILQQAEKAGLVEKITGKQYGRRLTQQGRDFLDSIEVETTPMLVNLEEVKVQPKVTVEEKEEHTEEETQGEEDGK
jgi:small subunit ribosomal protein S19e